jgi:hypothetical protein
MRGPQGAIPLLRDGTGGTDALVAVVVVTFWLLALLSTFPLMCGGHLSNIQRAGMEGRSKSSVDGEVA